MEYKDYYQTLGVSRDADAKQIKRAFRKLARELHPDVNPGDKAAETRFKEVAEAYEVLGDPAKREKYDQFGRQWQQYERAGQAGGFDWSQWQRQGRPDGQYTYTTAQDLEELFGQGAGGFGGAGGFSDFFEALFGGRAPGATGTRPRGGRGGPSAARGRPAGGAAGRDLEHPVQVTLAEAYGGSTRLLNKDGRRLEVTIPAGVRTGSKVRVAGEGAPGHEKAGDLYLVIEVLDDPRFQRDGDDLSTDVEVPLVTAILGGEARVPTPTGELVLAIPAETQNARRFRLRGKGMPKLRHPEQRGDLYATVRVKLPTGLSVEEKALFERLQELRA